MTQEERVLEECRKESQNASVPESGVFSREGTRQGRKARISSVAWSITRVITQPRFSEPCTANVSALLAERETETEGHFARVTNRDNSSVLAGCYRELSSGMNEAGCRLYLRPRANSPDKAGKPQSGQMRVHRAYCATEACPKIIYLTVSGRQASSDNALRARNPDPRAPPFIGLSKLSATLIVAVLVPPTPRISVA